MDDKHDVRCNDDGSIDIGFYKLRAHRVRREAQAGLLRSALRFCLTWLRNTWGSMAARVVKP